MSAGVRSNRDGLADDLMVERVEELEKAVESLVELPQRMTTLEGRMGHLEGRVGSLELQIVQLRTEMKDGFSAVRGEFLEVFDAGSRATEMLFKETWALMRTLHEDVIERIKQLGDSPS